MFKGIDLFSDTVTRPTVEMKRAMCEAPLGDEQKEEDPTTRRFERHISELLGKDDALFFPSSTMCNQVALLLQCDRGDAIIAAANAHTLMAEGGGPALWANVLTCPIETRSGIFSGTEINSRFIHTKAPHLPSTRLVVVENTTNLGGGEAWPLEALDSVRTACQNLGLRMHLDGARLFNAAVAVEASPRDLARGFDTVTLCLSKGLGCPAGAALAFGTNQRERVRFWKQRLGGSLRQSGMLAAAGLYALEQGLEPLREDHTKAARLAEGLGRIAGLRVEPAAIRTNMVFFCVQEELVDAFDQGCQNRGVRFSRMDPGRFRAVTHRDVDLGEIDQALERVQAVCKELG